MLTGLYPFRRIWEKSFFAFSSAAAAAAAKSLQSHLTLCDPVDIVFIPWLVVPHHIALHSLGFHLPVTSLPSERQLPSYKNPCDYTGPSE